MTAGAAVVTGFPALIRRYRISSVPKTVVGEEVEFVGAGPESMLLQHVQDAAKKGAGLVVP